MIVMVTNTTSGLTKIKETEFCNYLAENFRLNHLKVC